MEMFLESVDYTDAKLAIYEKYDDGQISESEKDALMVALCEREMESAFAESVVMGDISKMAETAALAVAGIAVIAALTALIVKIASHMRIKDKIRASTELTSLNNDLKKRMKTLKDKRSELQAIISSYRTEMNDAENRAAFYGSRVIRDDYTSYNYGTHQASYNVAFRQNMQYDADRAVKEQKKADKIEKIVNKYIRARDDVNQQIKELKSIQSRFISIVRQNAPKEESDKVRAQVDAIMAKLHVKS